MMAWALVVHAQAATNFVTTVADAGPGSLRQVIADATPDDVVTFGVTGIITLTNGEIVISNNLQIAGPGTSSLSICGSNRSRIFNISAGASVTISGVTLCDGHAADGTDGDAHRLSSGGPGEPGGAIWTGGELNLNDCWLKNNSAGKGGNGVSYYPQNPGGTAGGPGGDGGAIFNIGTLSLTNCILETNSAGAGGWSGAYLFGPMAGPGGLGGGIRNLGIARLHKCVVRGNFSGAGGATPTEEPGAAGGHGAGVASSSNLVATSTTFCNNRAGAGGPGGSDTDRAGAGGSGGSGGGLYLENTAALTNCTIVGNTAGTGGTGGDSYQGTPGIGGAGGNGGALLACSTLSLVNCTVCNNAPGNGGNGGYRSSPYPSPAPAGATGACGGLTFASSPPAQLLNTISAGNTGMNPDVSGPLTSLGHNLISATNGSSAFTNASDLTGSLATPLGARLGALANNGGPTPTIALLPGSPALDAGTVFGAPLVDQRGMIRPHGLGVDIGAYEVQFDLPFIDSISMPAPGTCRLTIWGVPNQSYTIEQSSNLLDWDSVTTQQTDSSGVLEITNAPNRDFNFYRMHTRSN